MAEEDKCIVKFDEEFLEKVKADAAKVRAFAIDDFKSGEPEKIELNLFLFATLQIEKHTKYLFKKFESEISEKKRAVPEQIFCQNCQEIVAIVRENGFRCSECGEQICIKCGCTESEACPEGCDWSQTPGICTRCADGN